MSWVKIATIKPELVEITPPTSVFDGRFIFVFKAGAIAPNYELHSNNDVKPDTALAISTGTAELVSNTHLLEFVNELLPASIEMDLWIDNGDYTLIDASVTIGEIKALDVSGLMFNGLTHIVANRIGLDSITGITTLTALENINISNNSMTSAQVNAIVDDVFDMAITNAINNGTLNITGNDSPTGDSLLKYEALVGKGWNSGTPITEISNRFELEAISLLLSGNYLQVAHIDLDGAGAVWLDTDGTTVVSSPVPGGSLDVTACDNYYTDAVISGIFTGSFDGNNHHIYNLAIKQQTDVEKHCGLFEQGNGCQITKLTVSGNIQAHGASASGCSGGVIGYITGSSATIDKSISNVNCLSVSRVGGFVGANYSSATITDCYSTGAVSFSGTYAGGFVGSNLSSTITACYSTGDVSSSGMYAGGFVGFNAYSATITTSFCYGEVSGISTRKGAFTGRNTTSDILDCYYRGDYYTVDFPAIGLDGTGETNTADITPLTEAEFRDASSFVGFDFEEKWYLNYDKGYPMLLAFGIEMLKRRLRSRLTYKGRR